MRVRMCDFWLIEVHIQMYMQYQSCDLGVISLSLTFSLLSLSLYHWQA
jgi:hypothetical protein